jgi:hypothetical protein
MQKVPGMPTTPYQGGNPIFSNPTADAVAVTETRLYLRSIMGVGLTLAVFIAPLAALF